MDASSTSEDAPVQLRWNIGAAGCLGVILIPMVLVFAWWGANPGRAPTEGRNRAFWDAVADMSAGGVGWGYLAFALFCALMAAWAWMRFIWPVALTAEPAGLRLHGIVGRGLIRWTNVTYAAQVSGRRRKGIELRFAKPYPLGSPFSPAKHAHILWGVDLHDGAGDRFVAAVDRFRRTSV